MLGERDNIAGYLADVGLIAALFCVLSLSIGYAVPRLLGLGESQAVASGFEIGIHNSTLAIAMAITVLESTPMSIPPAVYGVIMFPIAAVFGLVVRGRREVRKDPTLVAGWLWIGAVAVGGFVLVFQLILIVLSFGTPTG